MSQQADSDIISTKPITPAALFDSMQSKSGQASESHACACSKKLD